MQTKTKQLFHIKECEKSAKKQNVCLSKCGDPNSRIAHIVSKPFFLFSRVRDEILMCVVLVCQLSKLKATAVTAAVPDRPIVVRKLIV